MLPPIMHRMFMPTRKKVMTRKLRDNSGAVNMCWCRTPMSMYAITMSQPAMVG